MKKLWRSIEDYLFHEDSKVVKVLELLIVSGCPYCSAIRALIFGLGVGMWSFAGLGLVLFAIALNHIEKRINDE
jgi:hypothetical protein